MLSSGLVSRNRWHVTTIELGHKALGDHHGVARVLTTAVVERNGLGAHASAEATTALLREVATTRREGRGCCRSEIAREAVGVVLSREVAVGKAAPVSTSSTLA